MYNDEKTSVLKELLQEYDCIVQEQVLKRSELDKVIVKNKFIIKSIIDELNKRLI